MFADSRFNFLCLHAGSIKLPDSNTRKATYLKQLGSNTRNAISSLSQLAQSQLQQANHLNYYAERIEAHAQAIEKLNKVLDKLDRLLSQRRLGE